MPDLQEILKDLSPFPLQTFTKGDEPWEQTPLLTCTEKCGDIIREPWIYSHSKVAGT